MTKLNDRKNPTRCIKDELFGIACYTGGVNDEKTAFVGTHTGVVGTLVEAERWLAGDDASVKPLKIHQ